ncbi:MAG: hypothetical protein R6U19_03740 [Bacteroidales bacterium]
MIKKISILACILIGLSFFTKGYAQYDVDALRFSYFGFGGTARSMAVGGAFGAAGADLSVLSSNPGGIGLYKSSEFVISPSFYYQNVESLYYGQTSEDIKYAFNFPGIGVILNMENKNSSWKNVQFGFGFNKLNDFNQRTEIEGFNHESSLMTEYMDKANAESELSFYDTELANRANLLYFDSLSNQYIVDAPAGEINQRKSIEEKGGINEMTFSFGGNFEDIIYAGMTIGLPIVNYSMTSRHAETDQRDSINMFRSFALDEEITTIGSGVNFKFGIIARPVKWVRLGGAVHTPTFYSLKEEYARYMTSRFEDNEFNETNVEASGEFDYRLITPMKALGDIAIIIGKFGFLSAEYEYVDYSKAKLSDETNVSTPYVRDFKDDNDAIKAKYTEAHNIKFGAEANLKPIQIRGGYAIYGSPFAGDINDGERTYYTFGLGLREKQYYVDLAYIIEEYQEDYYLYSPEYVQAANNTYNSNRLVLTLGLRL